MRHYYILIISLLICSFGFGQTTIWSEDFETDGQGTRYTASNPFNDGTSDHWNRTDGSDISNISGAYSLFNGSFFWAAEDTDDTGTNGGNGNGEQTIQFNNINISGYESLVFSGFFGAGNENPAGSNAYDAADYIKVTYRVDSDTDPFVDLLWFSYQNNGDAFNEPLGLDVNFDGTQDGKILGTEMQKLYATISELSGSDIDLKISVYMDSGNEEIAFDNLSLQGFNNTLLYTDNFGWDPNPPNGTTNSNDVRILDGDATLSNSGNASFFAMRIDPGASLTVDSGVTLDGIILDLESNSSEYASLILDGDLGFSLQNNVTYRRWTNAYAFGGSGGNDLITSPVTDLFFGDFIEDLENSGNQFPEDPIDPLNHVLYNDYDEFDPQDFVTFAFAPWDPFGPLYQNYGYDIANPGDGDDYFEEIFPFKGYRVAPQFGTTMAFRGGVNKTDVSTNDVQAPGFDPLDKWNLVGNPYPSYLNSQTFLTSNSDLIDLNFQAIYGYNDSTDGNTPGIWTIINNVQNTDINIAPGQGFYVAARYDSNDPNHAELLFTTGMRTTLGTDDFIQGRTSANKNHLALMISDSESSSKTDIYFTDSASKGLDPGSDAGIIKVSPSNFYIFTHLVEDNNGIDMAIQALSQEDMNSVVVPLGLNVSQGQQLIISLKNSDLPDSINIYLEDNVENQWTLLNASDYIFTPSTNIIGTGRFFVHFTTGTLSSEDTILNGIQIYSDSIAREVVINGELNSDARATIFDIQGRQVIYKELNSELTSNRINVNNLSTGLYIVELSDYNKKRTQKIIIK